MELFGVLKESGFWRDGIFGKEFKSEGSWTVLCKSAEDAGIEACSMWERLCSSDKHETVIKAVKRELSDEEFNLIKEEYFSVDDEEHLKEIAVSEDYDITLELSKPDSVTIIKDGKFHLYDCLYDEAKLNAKSLVEAEREADAIIKNGGYREDSFLQIVKDGKILEFRKWFNVKPYEGEGRIEFEEGFFADWNACAVDLGDMDYDYDEE